MNLRETMTGGCQCGRVRYRVKVVDHDAYLRHCRICQRATGSVAAALKQVPRAAVTWLGTEPDRYPSSPIALRGFRSTCGTPLTYEGNGSDQMDLTVGSFDDPSGLRPASHSGIESWHPAWLDTHALPAMRTQDLPHIVQQWKDASGKLPD